MRTFAIELRKEKRTGVIPLMLAVGILGAAYAFIYFHVRKDTLLNLPLAPMDVLLTQLYGMIAILNMFGIIVAACILYHMEFQGSAVKKCIYSSARSSYVFMQIFNFNDHALGRNRFSEFGTYQNWSDRISTGHICISNAVIFCRIFIYNVNARTIIYDLRILPL